MHDRSQLVIKTQSLSAEEWERLKEAFFRLKLKDKLEWRTAQNLSADKEFMAEILRPLEEFFGWNKENEAAVAEAAVRISEKPTIRERKEAAASFFRKGARTVGIAAGAALLGAAAVVIGQAVVNGRKDKKNK